MNAAAFDALSGKYSVNTIAPINPGINYLQKAVSKLRRTLGRPGAYYFYSESRLLSISLEVEKRCSGPASLDFFHGFTPWISTRSDRPYAASSDCTFKDYISIYHDKLDFLDLDLSRIINEEAAWLQGADAVIFSSQWAAARAKSDYSLDPIKVHVIPPIGELKGFGKDFYSGGFGFTFISTNFFAKGGPSVVAAFQRLKRIYKDVRLTVVGDMPPGARSGQGIEYTGYLRKEVEAERHELIRIFSESRAIVNCSVADIAPIVLVEAASYGCPVVSTNRFAIPEIVVNEVTGILVDDEQDLVGAMEKMLADVTKYLLMRRSALEAAKSLNSAHRFQEQLCATVDTLL